MKTMKWVAVLGIVLSLASVGLGQGGQVKFRGMVTVGEAHDVFPVCYGDHHVTVAIDSVLEDPEGLLGRTASVQVCYEPGLGLTSGESVEVNGYYWAGGTCPMQYCGRVQIIEPTHYVTRMESYGDNDWMVTGKDMHAIPSGNVGVGTSDPQEKLHVVGDVLVEGASPVWLNLIGGFGDDTGILFTTEGVGVNTWDVLREGESSDLLIRERFPYPPFGGDRVAIQARTGNVGIGTKEPDVKLHVFGEVRIEAPMTAKMIGLAAASNPPLHVVKSGQGAQLLAYFDNPRDTDGEVEIQLAGGTMLPWGWSLKAASGRLTLGSVMVFPPALNVKSTGYLGLGDTDPSYRLELPNTANASGQARANSWRTYSSARWKTNVRRIEEPMDKVRRLRGVYFDWKGAGTRDMGMIAEEVGGVIPEVVGFEPNGADAESLAYDRLVALLIEALKEQDTRIAELEQALARTQRLEQRLGTLENLIQRQASPAPATMR